MTSPEEDAERLRAEIERTREQLSENVQALTYKADVPARAREKLQDTKDAAQDRVRQLTGQAAAKLPEPVRERGQQAAVAVRQRPAPALAAAVAMPLLLLLVRMLRRRRRWAAVGAAGTPVSTSAPSRRRRRPRSVLPAR